MNLVIIAGFPGYGKTTLLLSIAKALSAAGKKMAVSENEVGDNGVDDAVFPEVPGEEEMIEHRMGNKYGQMPGAGSQILDS